jgi:hypothetical protein
MISMHLLILALPVVGVVAIILSAVKISRR